MAAVHGTQCLRGGQLGCSRCRGEEHGETAVGAAAQQTTAQGRLRRRQAQADTSLGLSAEAAEGRSGGLFVGTVFEVENPGGTGTRHGDCETGAEVRRIQAVEVKGGSRSRGMQHVRTRALALDALKKGHFHHFFVNDRAMPEVTTFTEALAMIGGDDEVGVAGGLGDQGVESSNHPFGDVRGFGDDVAGFAWVDVELKQGES